MPPRSQLLTVVVAALVGAALFWLILEKRARVASTPAGSPIPSTPAASEQARPAVGAPTTTQEPTPKRNFRDPRLAKVLETFSGTPSPRGKISREVIEQFLEKRSRTPLALLAAWQESGDVEYLRAALAAGPNDPSVLMAAAFEPSFAGEQAELFTRLREAELQNPLPVWLLAANQLRAGQKDAAFRELLLAEGRNNFDNNLLAVVDERQALFEAAGFDPLRAEIEALFGLALPYAGSVREMAKTVTTSLPELRAKGQGDLAMNLAATTVNLGRAMIEGNRLLIDQLIGFSLETSALSALGDSAGEMLGGQNPAARLAALEQQRNEIRDFTKLMDTLRTDATYEQFREYLRISRTDGELHALRWLAQNVRP